MTLASLLPFRVRVGVEDTGDDSSYAWMEISSGSNAARVRLDLPSRRYWDSGRVKVHYINDIPVLYVRRRPEYLFQGGRCGFDILGAVFYLLSRTEEYHAPRDMWDTFPVFYSSLYVQGVWMRPLVNLWARVLEKELRTLAKQKNIPLRQVPLWPDGHTFALAITHDVDVVSTSVWHHHLTRWRDNPMKARRVPLLVAKVTRSIVKGAQEHHFLDDWIELEEQYGLRSTFYFSVPVDYRHLYDNVYRFDERIHFRGRTSCLSDVMREVADEGWEVGLHSTYNSYDNPVRLRFERMNIERVTGRQVLGVRQHWLHFDAGLTWPAQETAGFLYDSTLGYNESPSYRAGIAFPFRPYHISEYRVLHLWELPMTIMDKAVFGQSGLRMDEFIGMELCRRVVADVALTGGLVVVNWHLQYRDEHRYPGWWNVYKSLLSYAQELGAWIAPAGAISEYWDERVRLLGLDTYRL